ALGMRSLGELYVSPVAFRRVGLGEQLEIQIGQSRARGFLVEADSRAIELGAHRRRLHDRLGGALTPLITRVDPPAILHRRPRALLPRRRRAAVRLVAHAARRDTRARAGAKPLPLRLTWRSMRLAKVSALRSASAQNT